MFFKSVATIVFATLGIPAVAGDANPHVVDMNINCGVASDIGRRAYVRAQNSQAAGDNWTAFAHATAFWDLEQHSQHCSEIVQLANEMNGTRLGKGAAPPAPPEGGAKFTATGKCLENPPKEEKHEAATQGKHANPLKR